MATFNARAETVETKPFFRDAFKRTRCLIPVSGYYEWQDTPDGKQPWYFTARDGSPALTIAGLWDSWKNPETGEPLLSCTMIITESNTMVSGVHDRMLVLLMEKQFEPWLGGDAGVLDPWQTLVGTSEACGKGKGRTQDARAGICFRGDVLLPRAALPPEACIPTGTAAPIRRDEVCAAPRRSTRRGALSALVHHQRSRLVKA